MNIDNRPGTNLDRFFFVARDVRSTGIKTNTTFYPDNARGKGKNSYIYRIK